MGKKITVADIQSYKNVKKVVVLTAYDYPTAKVLDQAGVDIILVGDSLGMVVLGDTSTKNVTMDDMKRHTAAVRRGVKDALVVADMPAGSFIDPESAVTNAQALIDAGAEAVKIEGGSEMTPVFSALSEAHIPVMGHLGLTPQTAQEFKVQGKTKDDAQKIFDEARKISQCGIFAVVLECVPTLLGECITQNIAIPTIGIGAGNKTDGQVLVIHDVLGLCQNMRPKFVRQFVNLSQIMGDAVQQYKDVVMSGDFPNDTESFKMDEQNLPII